MDDARQDIARRAVVRAAALERIVAEDGELIVRLASGPVD